MDQQVRVVDREGSALGSKPPWQRLLWKRQPYPDNYVPDSFLNGLRTNSSISLPPLGSIIISSLPISLQFSLILTSISAFYHLRYGTLEPSDLFLISISLLLVGWSSLFVIQLFTLDTSTRCSKTSASTSAESGIESLQMRFGLSLSYVLLPLILLALSPVLKTLTEATTDDSIWALSSILFFTNWSLADYTDVQASQLKLKLKSKRGSDQRDLTPAKLVSASNPVSSPSSSPSSRKLSFSSITEPPSLSGSAVSSHGRQASFSLKQSRTTSSASQTSSQPQLLPVPLPTGPSLPPTPPPLPSSLSLNASISASVVLASRLVSSFQVFNLIFFASILFAGVPRWRIKVLEISLVKQVLTEIDLDLNITDQDFPKSSPRFPCPPSAQGSRDPIQSTSDPNRNPHGQKRSSGNQRAHDSSPKVNLNLFLKIFLPLLSISISLYLTSTISKQVTFLSSMVIVFISLICPIWMKWAQRWKNEMRGPWDVGIVRVRT